ncbi:MAG TPA: GAF domain-containing protein [Polyangia bacterium]|nr:GAF domain-containing protein [Polyangia bacterium]
MKQGVSEKIETVETEGAEAEPAPKRSKRSAAQRGGGMQRQAQLLLDVANKVASESTLDGQLQMLIELSVAAVGAERGSLFLKDDATGELYTRVAQGTSNREIRIPPDTGIAGHVFTSGEGVVENDAYTNPKFNRAIDERTGFTTKKILCAPVRTVRGETIGVIQILNRPKGDFSKTDLILVEAMTQQASIVLQSTMHIESAQRFRLQESQFIDVVSEVSKEIQLGPLLQKIMASVTELLQSERSTLFLNDEKTNMLYTEIGQGLGAARIRFPNHLGIAGTVFTSGKSVNIPYAYADLRFNPSFDKQTGFFTRSILCVPVINKDGKTIGVTQVLNKRGGTFTQGDETRLKAFTAQIAICLENAKLFDDVQNMKNYNEAMLESMSNGVITFDDKGKIVTCNAAGARVLRTTASEMIGRKAEEFFTDRNAWIVERMLRVQETQKSDVLMDAEMATGAEKASVNVTFLPLQSNRQEKMGTMLLIEDISSEKRVKATMSRYMDPSLADKLISAGEEILGGQASAATVLFSDIRSFTTLTEELGPQGTVQMLNEYFTVMVECIQQEGGMLDKFIGDAIMAVFGTPLAHDDDEDRALRAAITMMKNLELFNADRIKHGKMPIDIGVGINSDIIVSGNIGSPKRMDYTVIGDGVNLASRLEGATKEYAAHILISENTFAKLRGTYRLREIDWVVVKGKTKPVAIYEVLDYHTEESFPNLVELLPCFKGGLSRYREGRFDDAVASFQRCLEYNPRDKLSGIYVSRCEYLKKSPPEGKWDGIWRMKSK